MTGGTDDRDDASEASPRERPAGELSDEAGESSDGGDGRPPADGADDTRLLHVDDDESALSRLGPAVERSSDDVAVRATSDGTEARRLLDASTVDALVIDQQASGVDGDGLVTDASVPVVLYTDAAPAEIPGPVLERADGLVEKWTADQSLATVAERIVAAVHGTDGAPTPLTRAFERERVDPPRSCQFLLYEDGTVVWQRTSLADFLERRDVDVAVPESSNFYRKLTAVLADDPAAIGAIRDGSVATEPVRFSLPTSDGEAQFRYVEHDFPETFGPVRLVAVEDVTRNGRATARLELLELFDEHVHDGIAVIDGSGRIEYHNESFARLVGVDDAVGDPVAAYLADGERETGRREIERLRASDAHSDVIDVEFDTADGDRRTLAVHAAVRGTVGEFAGVVTVARDVTERREREAQLERYRQLVENVTDPMFVADEDCRIACCNEALATLFYAAKPSLIGTRLGDFLPDAAIERLTNARERAVETGESAICEVEVSSAGAVDRRYEVTVSPLQSDGDVTGTVGVFHDVTERERRESELDLLKQVLTRVLRHDVRTGLTVIRGQAEVLAERTSGEEREMAETILARSEELVETTEKVRAIERVIDNDDGRTTLDLRTVVNRAVANVGAAYPEATYDVRIAGRLPVTVHRAFPYAVENLVENAVEHSSTKPRSSSTREDAVEHSSTSRRSQAPDDAVEHSSTNPRSSSTREDAVEHSSTNADSDARPVSSDSDSSVPKAETSRHSGRDRPTPHVTVSATVEEESVELSVADDGPGIAADELDVLDRREETPLKHGTGVGLWLVDWVVERSGGDLVFDTGEDGTTVIVRVARGDPADLGTRGDDPADLKPDDDDR